MNKISDHLGNAIDQVFQGIAPDMEPLENLDQAAEVVADCFDMHNANKAALTEWAEVENKIEAVASIISNYF